MVDDAIWLQEVQAGGVDTMLTSEMLRAEPPCDALDEKRFIVKTKTGCAVLAVGKLPIHEANVHT